MNVLHCRFVVFDLDGVLVDSQAVVERHWRRWARRHDLDPERVLRVAHGRRTIDAIRDLAPALDAEREVRRMVKAGSRDTNGLEVLRGARTLIQAIPDGQWGVATSGTRITAETRLRHTGLPVPEVLITADDVEAGKPAPEVYQRAALALDGAPEEGVVIEDTPAGIRAGQAAGMRVVAVLTTYDPPDVAMADAVVDGPWAIRTEQLGDEIALHLGG
jgi:sugar-phosphatase